MDARCSAFGLEKRVPRRQSFEPWRLAYCRSERVRCAFAYCLVGASLISCLRGPVAGRDYLFPSHAPQTCPRVRFYEWVGENIKA